MYSGAITDIRGVSVGCSGDGVKMTGCTAVMFDKLCVASADVRGGGPGTINTDVLEPTTGGGVADCVMLAGGSAFGLECVAGAMRYLEERGRGFDTRIKRVPMVPGAIIFDLGLGDIDARPDADMGYRACAAAGKCVPQGSFGAGMGATVGKVLGEGWEKSGQGTAAIDLGDGIIVAAICVVNALGDIWDGERIVAGVVGENGAHLDAMRLILRGSRCEGFGANTTISVVATNLKLSCAMAKKLAMMAHDGYAMAIRPAHTLADGDTVFGVSTGEIERDSELNRVLAAAVEVTRRAIVNAGEAAHGR